MPWLRPCLETTEGLFLISLRCRNYRYRGAGSLSANAGHGLPRRRSPNPRPGAQVQARGYPLVNLLFASYLVLVTLLSFRVLRALRSTRRRIRALPLADNPTCDEVRTLAEWIGLNHAPEVRTTNDEMTPYVFGFRRAVLVLPERMMRVLDTSERRALILHELAHIRRGDPLIRRLQSLAGVFFFFFPPVLWVCRRVEHFTEMACDRWAVAVSEMEPYAYAGALLKVVKEVRHVPQVQVGLPLVRGVRLLEERLREVLRRNCIMIFPGAAWLCWASVRTSTVATRCS